MKLLIALLAAIGAVAAAVFFLRKNQESASAPWSHATDSMSSWSKTAAEKAVATTDKMEEKAREATGAVTSTAQKTTSAASDFAEEAKGAASDVSP